MSKYIYLFLALASAASAVWYVASRDAGSPGASYQNTYAYISIGAAAVFAGLFLASFFGRDRAAARRRGTDFRNPHAR